MITEEIDEDIYNEESIGEFVDADEITKIEAGFMEGYIAS